MDHLLDVPLKTIFTNFVESDEFYEGLEYQCTMVAYNKNGNGQPSDSATIFVKEPIKSSDQAECYIWLLLFGKLSQIKTIEEV